MDEQRMQDYLTLIEKLLACPLEQEAELLNAYPNLLDVGLLAIMEHVVINLEIQGDSNAKWLRDFSVQLAEIIRGEQTILQDLEVAHQFLWETMQFIVFQQFNPQQIYPLWAQQKARFNTQLLEVFPNVITQFLQGEMKQRIFLAHVLGEFGNLIQRFPLGARRINLELSIVAYKKSLQVLTYETMPLEWSILMNNLGSSYYHRIEEDRADNIDRAIDCYEKSLKIRNQKDMPVEWAETLNNLALAYAERTRGDCLENIQAAIDCHEQALYIRTRKKMPVKWAQSMHNLAHAYYRLYEHITQEFDSRNDLYQPRLILDKAIAAYENSLQVRTQDELPVEWATSISHLATAYHKRSQHHDREEDYQSIDDVRKAITLYKQSLEVMKQEEMPFEWAAATMSLAGVYADLSRNNILRGTLYQQAETVNLAIAAYQDSLTVLTPEWHPRECRRTARSFGNLCFEERRWEEATIAYEIALKAAELLYQNANLRDSRLAELTESASFSRPAAYAFARTGNFKRAIEILEQGRARELSESLNRDRADLTYLQQTHPDLYQDYKAITLQLRNLENQQRDQMASEERYSFTPEALRDTATSLHQQLTVVLQNIRQVPGYENFLTLPNFADIQASAQASCPFVYVIHTSAGGLTLFVTNHTISYCWLDALTENMLQDVLMGLGDDQEPSRWFGAFQDFRNDPKANYLEWCKEIERSTRQLWEPLMQPLIQHLKTQNCHQAILILTGPLSFLPLHAAWTEDPSTPTGRRYALDDIHFTYAPNAKSLTAAHTIAQRTGADSILAIDNPSQDLPNSEREVNAAIASFPKNTVLRHGAATVEGVRSQLSKMAIAHFSCHGTANLADPLNSGLVMSDGLLTLRDIFALNLADQNGLRLAILSACETGLSGIENADEAISLPTGLLQAGVAGVVASLWSVSDLSTMILLSRFYTLWQNQAMSPATALRCAQQWLRDASPTDIVDHCRTFIPDLDSHRELRRSLKYDYSHPFHWSAFSYTGV